MFTRKYQRIAAEHRDKGAVFLEIMGDESADTRVSTRMRVTFNLALCFTCIFGFALIWQLALISSYVVWFC